MIEVPTITPEDLLEFHKSHFKTATPIGLERLNDEAPVEEKATPLETEEEDVEDDGLGYYADGTKRTLTDKQIAFFRSSELRKRVLASQEKNQRAAAIAKAKETSSASTGASNHNHAVRESVEETKAFTPIANSSLNYASLFGSYGPYILQIDQAMDNRYINAARRKNLQDYYPVLPIHEL